jgi:DNA-binding phage protein
MSKSISYHPFLLDNLKDPNYAALYLETHLEEDEFEFDPELLKMALRNVLEALGDSHLTAEQIKIYEQFLDKLLTMPAGIGIYNLGLWLKALGLKIAVTVDKEGKNVVENLPSLNGDNKEKYEGVLTKVPDVETENSRGEAFGQ